MRKSVKQEFQGEDNDKERIMTRKGYELGKNEDKENTIL